MTALLGREAADQKGVLYHGGPKKINFGSAVSFIYLLQGRLPSLSGQEFQSQTQFTSHRRGCFDLLCKGFQEFPYSGRRRRAAIWETRADHKSTHAQHAVHRFHEYLNSVLLCLLATLTSRYGVRGKALN